MTLQSWAGWEVEFFRHHGWVPDAVSCSLVPTGGSSQMAVKRCPSETECRWRIEAAEEDRIDSSWSTQRARWVPRCWDHDTHSYHCYWRGTRTYCDGDEWRDEETGMYENSHCEGHHQEGDA
jgi:hypothetical protein